MHGSAQARSVPGPGRHQAAVARLPLVDLHLQLRTVLWRRFSRFLPRLRLSEFDVELYFALTDSDVAAINERFRHDRRAGAAIQLVFLRASGHSLGQVSTLPRQLLHYIGQRLGLPTPTIASLRTLYRRYKTLYDHLIWACGYLGLKSIGPD